MTTKSKITLVWRNENYGTIANSMAFRVSGIAAMDEVELQELTRIFGRHGFSKNNARQSWIAAHQPADTPIQLSRLLNERGYDVKHGGCVPEILQDALVKA